MLLAVLLLSFGVAQAADSVAVGIYDVTNAVLLDPSTDTIYTLDVDGNPLSYQIWISLENDVGLGAVSLGFRFWSVDGVTWQYDAQVGGWGPAGENTGLSAVTVMAGSRLDPPADVFDMTELLVLETDVDGQLDDIMLVGGVGLFDSLAPGPMEAMMAIHFTPGGVAWPDVKTFCIDSTFVPPAANWLYTDPAGGTFPPAIAPAICMPVASLDESAADDESPVIPFTFDLGQNYPNPFNPATVINYSVARKTKVDISVYNILGQRVVALVNEEIEAGPHQVIWDGNDDHGDQVASGIYFYKMYTDDFVETRKMALMR
jgi:hypothetical protein